MQELIDKVVEWAEARNLISGSTPEKQLEKTAAELIELAIEVGVDKALLSSGEYFANPLLSEQQSGRVASELGDVLVTVIIAATQLGLEVEDCLAIAYDKIKDRKGKMIGGKFVKEEDL